MNTSLLKKLSLVIIFCAFFTNSFAQEVATQTFKQIDIVGKKWESERGSKYFTKFTNTKIICSRYWFGKLRGFNGKSKYYLSDTPDTIFDKSKVGKSNSGKYIIISEGWLSSAIGYEILLLTKDTLVLRILEKYRRIGGSDLVIWYAEN